MSENPSKPPANERNVTLPPNKQTAFPCPICGMQRNIRDSKREKPYVVCDDCGVQLFVRKAEGIKKFKELAATGAASHIIQKGRVQRAVELHDEIKKLKIKRSEVEDQSFFSIFNDDSKNAVRTIDQQIIALESELHALGEAP